jgi:hypothetical protein
VFVRPPSNGEFYAFEQKYFPRAETWDLLLTRTGLRGIHFDDYPQLQGYYLPEWSHIAAPDAARFTAALVPIVEHEFKAPGSHIAQANATASGSTRQFGLPEEARLSETAGVAGKSCNEAEESSWSTGKSSSCARR